VTSVDYSAIGRKIKELRKTIGITQGELAKGICTQALISRVEKGDIYPSATVLYEISQRLGVDVNYFFEIGLTPRLDYVKEVEHQLKVLRRDFQYEEMMEIVRMEEQSPLFTNNEKNLQLLYWHKGIYLFEAKHDREASLQVLQQALELTNTLKKAWTEREMEILLSMGAVYFKDNFLEKALEIYNDVRSHLKSYKQLQDITIKTRLLYNLSRVYTRLGDYKKSICLTNEGIQWCRESEHMFIVGQFHYNLGYNYEFLHHYDEAVVHYEKAQLIFHLQNDDKYDQYIEERLEKLKKAEK
jgi:transcriptional regulator with XRE-family HTH domain